MSVSIGGMVQGEMPYRSASTRSRKSSNCNKFLILTKGIAKSVFYLDQVGNIEAQGEEEKRGTNEPVQCSTIFTGHDFLKIRNKNVNRV